jgi:hypothetical protein
VRYTEDVIELQGRLESTVANIESEAMLLRDTNFTTEDFAEIIDNVIATEINHLLRHIKVLEERIKELEATTLKYYGLYGRSVSYSKNSLITHRGSLWVTIRDTSATPPHDDYVLVSKGH